MLASNDPPLKRLYVSGIAEDQNNIQMLSDYFKQYGVISEVIIGYHGNPDVALVSFASHEEARAAFDDDQAVLGNPDIQVRWVVKGKKSVSEPSTSSSSTSSSSSPSKPSPNLTNQCQKCSKILASKHSLSNHMRQMHAEFNCPACHTVFESANEFRKHYNAEHSNGFVPRPMDSKDFFRANSNSTMNIDLTETLTTMRHKNASLVKKLKKYKKDKSKTAKNLQKQLVKLLEGQLKLFDFFQPNCFVYILRFCNFFRFCKQKGVHTKWKWIRCGKR